MWEISIFRHPINTLYHSSSFIYHHSKPYVQWCTSHITTIIIIAAVSLCIAYVPGPHHFFLQKFTLPIQFCLKWILLGVLSSVGLGTGLHTFVLYLGPYIAKYTLASYQCGTYPILAPNRWQFDHFDNCSADAVSYLGIVGNVYFESFLWGLGTAIGELPPYFISKLATTAREMNNSNEEERESCIMKFLRSILEKNLKNHTFIIVMLLASFPNPLFDMAGIMCGLFNISFWSFFLPTFVGKAINKVTMQVMAVVFIFSKQHVESLILWIKEHFSFIDLTSTLESVKNNLFQGKASEGNWLSVVWDIFVGLMILYFMLSILESIAKMDVSERKKK